MKTQQVAFRGVLLAFIGLLLPSSPTAFGESGCRIVTDGPRIELHSPFFVFSLPTAFAESSRTVELKVRDKNQPSENDSSIWTVLSPSTAVSKGGITLTKQPVELAEGGTLTFTLDQGYRDGPADHTIGRFRVSVTTAKPPLPHPIVKDAQRFAIEAQAPALSRGGTFVVAAELNWAAPL